MKLHLSFIAFLFISLCQPNQSLAQFNYTQKVESRMGLKYQNPNYSFPIRSPNKPSYSLMHMENDFKNNDQFLKFDTKSFKHYSLKKSFFSKNNNQNMNLNRRLKYSSLWAFTSLNYLYADLVGLMDLNLLSQYQTGIVNGIEITPAFLTAAAAYMQIPLSNVFLPHVIKNDKILRWVQIISGSIATIAQGATLFVGKPTPYYVLFSAIEMGATAFITIDAIKWKVGKNQKTKSKILF